MFINDNLLFIEMQKTGGSHILKLLSKFVGGEIYGKHHRLTDDLADRFVFGSIRNPWDWYVSLWAYGVEGKGAIRARTTKGLDIDYCFRMLPKSMGKNWLSFYQFITTIRNDLSKHTLKWESVYNNSNDPNLFRNWLKLMLGYNYRFDIGEAYGFSPLSSHSGLMTYRYLRLFTLGDKIYSDQNLSQPEGLYEFDKKHNVAQGIIRMEELEEDFITILKQTQYSLTGMQIEEIFSSKKTNTSSRHKTSYYYDQETLDLVAHKEQFLIEKFNYDAPKLSTSS